MVLPASAHRPPPDCQREDEEPLRVEEPPVRVSFAENWCVPQNRAAETGISSLL